MYKFNYLDSNMIQLANNEVVNNLTIILSIFQEDFFEVSFFLNLRKLSRSRILIGMYFNLFNFLYSFL